MKILIAADMEGITGVVHWDHVDTSHPEYSRFRHLMTGDVNAAILGVLDAGADEVIVSDGHAWGRNILIEELDQRARLNSGTPSPLSMVQGVDNDVDGVIFVGYHARIGTQFAILEHTWSDERVSGLWIHGGNENAFQPIGEIGLNAAVCGHFGVPVLMISGDRAACTEALETLGKIDTAIVKWANGRFAAECLPPEESRQVIHRAAYQAITRLVASQDTDEKISPFVIQPPISLAIDFVHSHQADRASILPGSVRMGRRLEFSAADMVAAYRAFRAAIDLAK